MSIVNGFNVCDSCDHLFGDDGERISFMRQQLDERYEEKLIGSFCRKCRPEFWDGRVKMIAFSKDPIIAIDARPKE